MAPTVIIFYENNLQLNRRKEKGIQQNAFQKNQLGSE